MVTTDEIPDPSELTLETRLNGTVVQHTTTDLMITDVPHLIEYISTILPLSPGDVRHRPRRRGPGLLAPRPQPGVRQRSASRLHALAPSGLAASSADRAVTGRVMTLLTALLAATAVLSSIAARPVPRFL